MLVLVQAYATGYGAIWDGFMRQIEPLATRMPYCERTPCTLQIPYKKTGSNPYKKWVLKCTVERRKNWYPGYHLSFSRSTQSAGGPGAHVLLRLCCSCRYFSHCDGSCDGLTHRSGGRTASMIMARRAPLLVLPPPL